MLLTNGRIYTLDRDGSVVDTLVVRDGRVAFAGRRADVNVSDAEERIDLGGRAVLPGLVDGHAHLMHLARLRLTLDVAGQPSAAAVASLVGAAATRATAGDWIVGRGWDQNRWPDPRFPSRATLDRAAPRNPVALVRIDGHAIWVNAAALRVAGITRATPDPTGGRILKDPGGEPTGGRARVHDLERLRLPSGGRARLARARQTRRPRRLLRGRLRLPRRADRRHRCRPHPGGRACCLPP